MKGKKSLILSTEIFLELELPTLLPHAQGVSDGREFRPQIFRHGRDTGHKATDSQASSGPATDETLTVTSSGAGSHRLSDSPERRPDRTRSSLRRADLCADQHAAAILGRLSSD